MFSDSEILDIVDLSDIDDLYYYSDRINEIVAKLSDQAKRINKIKLKKIRSNTLLSAIDNSYIRDSIALLQTINLKIDAIKDLTLSLMQYSPQYLTDKMNDDFDIVSNNSTSNNEENLIRLKKMFDSAKILASNKFVSFDNVTKTVMKARELIND